MLNRFLNDNSGNFAIMAGIVIVMLFVLGGAGVDFIRYTTLRSEMQSTADSAVLAAASLQNTQSPTVVAENYFTSNFDPGRFAVAPTDINFSANLISNTSTDRSVRVAATAQMPTFFLRLFSLFGGSDFSTLTVDVTAQAGEAIQNLELSVVLDVSGSMSGPKIDNLRTAGVGFINKIFDGSNPNNISFNVIPFSDNVNVGHLADTFVDPGQVGLPGFQSCVSFELSDFNEFQFSGVRDSIADVDPCVNQPSVFNTNNRNALLDRINTLMDGGVTDMHIGVAWGIKTLSPDFRGLLGGSFNSQRPADYNNKTLKVLVVMTDGRTNPSIGPGSLSTLEAETEIRTMCDDARTNGVVVYTIGFQVGIGSPEEVLLQDCASNLSQYFRIEGLNLQTAFDGIATGINRLRVTL